MQSNVYLNFILHKPPQTTNPNESMTIKAPVCDIPCPLYLQRVLLNSINNYKRYARLQSLIWLHSHLFCLSTDVYRIPTGFQHCARHWG